MTNNNKEQMLLIPTKVLMLVCAAVWLIAGFAVISVGVTASPEPWIAEMAIGFILTYAVFTFLFIRISNKHIKRICAYEEEMKSLFDFFDVPSYAILAIMIGIGASVRLSGLVPGQFIASFYCGLGFALVAAAVYFTTTYIHKLK
jgi:hypothetical protein